MTQMMMYPQMPMQQQAQTQSAVNIQTAVAFVPQVLQQMLAAGQITQPEYQTVFSVLQQPDQAQKFQMSVLTTFGEMNVGQQQIYNLVMTKIQNAIRILRQNQMTASTMPMVGQGFVPGGQMMPMAGGMIAPQSNAGQDLSDLYGAGQANMSAAMNPYPEQTMNQPASVSQEQQPVHATLPKRQPTGKPYDIDLSEDRIYPAPKWTKLEVKVPSQFAHKEFQTMADVWKIEYAQKQAQSAEVRLETPMASRIGAIADFTVTQPEFLEGKFAHVISYDQIVIGRMPFEQSKQMFDTCLKKYSSDMSDVLDVMKTINGSGSSFGSLLTGIILEAFNKAASVNFMRSNATNTGMIRMQQFSSFETFSRLIMDSGEFEDWKQDEDSFKQALGICLKASFNRVFRPSMPGYLDITDPKSRILILSDERTGFRFESGVPGRLVPYANQSEELNKEIDAQITNIFPMLVEKKIILHNLDIPKFGENDFKAQWLSSSPETLVLYDLFTRHGCVELVDVNDESQLIHPFVLGVGYGNQLLIRRV